MLANRVVRGTSPEKDPTEDARRPCLILGQLMGAVVEYLAWESLGVVLALTCGGSYILIKYRGFPAIFPYTEISSNCF